jgi:hypothetical protein
VIAVNIDKPEANREALVFPMKDMAGMKKGASYYGYYIMIHMDVRYFMDNENVEHYKARLFGNNKILLTVPAWDYCPLYNRDEVVLQVDSNVTDAMDDARHGFEENKATRQWKNLLLEFPGEHVLSSKLIYEDAGDDDELELEILSYEYSHPGFPGKTNVQHYAAWKVARSDVRASKRGKVEHKENKSKGASLLANLMNTHTS